MEKTEVIKHYALSFLGVPYYWGGNNRLGIDCSGLVCELLRAAGLIGVDTDLTAQGIYETVKKLRQHTDLSVGAIAFFGRSKERITHVGYILDESCETMIHAAHGSRDLKLIPDDPENKKLPEVKISSVHYRNDLQDIIWI